MTSSPLATHVLFHLGPVPISEPVVTTWGLMLLLTFGSLLATRRLTLQPGRLQTVLEFTVQTIEDQVREIMHTEPKPFLPLLGTLFLFLVFANLTSVIPGLKPPTAHIETAGALALIVFFSAQGLGIRRRGLLGYMAAYAKPTIVMLPLNIFSEITRTFSLMVRLFGNMLSGEFVIATILAFAGLFVPVPLMALEIVIGVIQAYIFTVLAAIFIGAAVGSIERG